MAFPGRERLYDIGLAIGALAIDLTIWGGGGRTGSADAGPPTWLIVLTAVLVSGVLLLRRTYPVAVFEVTWVYSLVAVIVPDFQPIAALGVAVYAVASRRPPATSSIAFALCLVPSAIDGAIEALNRQHQETAFVASFLVLTALYMLVFTVVWALGRIFYRASRRARNQLQQQELEAAEAIAAERRRLARELHDIVAHAVTAMLLQAGSAALLVEGDPARARSLLENVQGLGGQAMQELHRLLALLRTTDPDEHSPSEATQQPRIGDIDGLIDAIRADGQQVSLTVHGDPVTLDPSIDLAGYRVVQEGLTNFVKYSSGGQAQIDIVWSNQLGVRVRSTPAAERTEVADPRLSSGNGLLGLRERVTLLGGSLEYGAGAADFVLEARLPIRPDRHLERV